MSTRSHPPESRHRRQLHDERVAQRLSRLRADLSPLMPCGSPPFVLEIGCGHGHFLTAFARAHPGLTCLGIDQMGSRIRRAQKKASLLGRGNLHFLQAEATEFLCCLPPWARIRQCWVLFPDPWPKTRHHKHRVLQPTLLSSLASRMEPGGSLCLRTDHPAMARWALDLLQAHAEWAIDPAAPWPFEAPTVFQAYAQELHSLVARRL